MKIFFLLVLLFSNTLFAYDIDQMLDLYRKESDLSKKTKNEALGHLTVYTRDDLERMQAFTLSDLLNSLRSFRYDENMLGMPDVLHTDPSVYSSDVVKIFINDHEIASAFAGSGLYLYGNIDLGFVDHVEIYEGSASTYVTTGLSAVTIKLYSKDPRREVGTHIQLNAGSRKSHYENISYAGVEKDFDYYLYASQKTANREKYEHDGHTLSRDYTDKHALMTLSYKNIDVGAEILDHKMDPFLALSMFATPNDGNIDYLLKRISTTMTFLDDDSLKFAFSFIRVDGHMNLYMDRTIWSDNPLKIYATKKDSLVSDSIDDTYSAKLEKKSVYQQHNFIIGSEYSRRVLHDVSVYNNGIKNDNPDHIDNKILSGYIQDDYAVARNQILTASVKYNHYNSSSNQAHRVFNTLQFRAGYIITSESDVFKVFASQMELPTEQYVLDYTSQNYIELLRIRDYSAEYIKSLGKHRIGLCYEYLENENPILAREKGAPKYYGNHSVSVKYDYDFDPFNSLKSMYFVNQYHNNITSESNRVEGGFIRLLNSWNRFDFYNEADYHHLLDSKINGVQFNTGVRFKAKPALVFTLKGTNIFDSAAKSQYNYLKLVGFTPEMQSLYIPPIDRSVTIGMEYDF
jgi:iron complex outermembrane receptor protein